MYDGKTSSYRFEIFREKIVSVVPDYDVFFSNSYAFFYVYLFVKTNLFLGPSIKFVCKIFWKTNISNLPVCVSVGQKC